MARTSLLRHISSFTTNISVSNGDQITFCGIILASHDKHTCLSRQKTSHGTHTPLMAYVHLSWQIYSGFTAYPHLSWQTSAFHARVHRQMMKNRLIINRSDNSKSRLHNGVYFRNIPNSDRKNQIPYAGISTYCLSNGMDPRNSQYWQKKKKK